MVEIRDVLHEVTKINK